MLKLSKTHEKIVQLRQVGTFVITGEKQSGKTSVGTLRMLYLLEHACRTGERVLYVCNNEAEKEKVSTLFNEQYSLQNMSLFDEEFKGEAVIKSIDALIEEAANKADVHLNLEVCDTVPETVILAMIPQVKKAYPKVKWLNTNHIGFIHQEMRWINACGYATFEAYANATRKGAIMKLPKRGSGRKAIWMIKELVATELRRQGLMSKDQVQIDTLGYLKEDTLRECYKHIIIDDAENLTKVQLECIHALKIQGHGEVLFLMDKTKKLDTLAWLGSGNRFKTIGYQMTGRVKHLASSKKKVERKKKVEVQQTPLEIFMQEMSSDKQVLKAYEEKASKEKASVERLLLEDSKKSKVLEYVETYQYINKVTGVEITFQRDTSAGETYIDEVKQEEVDVLPIYSDIAAGMPIELVDEVSGQFELPSDLLHHKKNTYILHVQGDSMIGANISDGDYVVIQSGNVNNHEIAAVYYNGATTLKRIVQEDEHILLVSENPKYDPIVIEEGDFRVMGKLIGVIKPL
ncbi:MAG: hypothetical protein E7231_07560 [Cellulosilyticum sp.]|nr:hypothetical protein [Cellulosilyticum sp.]